MTAGWPTSGAYAIDGVTPVVHPTAFVHPAAALIGDVLVGAGCYIGPFASLRGDFGQIVVEAGANIQDGCVLHCFPGDRTLVERDGHVGHGAILHGCVVGRASLIGMRSIVMDGASIGEEAFVGAGSVVPAKFDLPARMLAVGTPATILRALTADEIAWKANGTRAYQHLAERANESLVATSPLTEVEPGRPALRTIAAVPLQEYRARAAERLDRRA
ncbi:MAG: phenylacetic acid degradation protein PaaY [Acidimicrobiales bacterium]|nr:phenylacetic acid degradation protein PaaY [Acidimicrobiales bacterium]